MFKKIPLLLVLFTTCVNAQNTYYFTKKDKKVLSKDSAFYYKQIVQNGEKDYTVSDFYMNGTKKMEGHYTSLEPAVQKGKFTFYDEEGKILSIRHFNGKENGTSTYFYPGGKTRITRNYKDGVEVDTLKSYYRTGELKRLQFFSKGISKGGKVFTKTGRDTTFYPYEETAAYPGTPQQMNELVATNLKYPKEAQKKKFKGSVTVLCLINEKGNLDETSILATTNSFLNESAVAFLKQIPKWTPARLDGVNVTSLLTITVPFEFK